MYRVAKELFDDLKKHALEAYPEECCGFILFDTEEEQEVVRRVRNVATERHQRDPQTFPRDGRDGYVMDEKALLEIQQDLDSNRYELRCIYHSHPNGKAYFSKEDEARAKLWDEPIYPEAVYIVLGVDGHSVTGVSGHQWNEERLEYEDVKIARA
jgi:[CysO sulfur-carrier protein]-S-L-cysteine hydrolase